MESNSNAVSNKSTNNTKTCILYMLLNSSRNIIQVVTIEGLGNSFVQGVFCDTHQPFGFFADFPYTKGSC